MAQLAPAATLVPHVLVSAKLLAFAPLNVIPFIVSVAVPVFVSDMVCAVEVAPTTCPAKFSDVVPKLTLAVGGDETAGVELPQPQKPQVSNTISAATYRNRKKADIWFISLLNKFLYLIPGKLYHSWQDVGLIVPFCPPRSLTYALRH